MKKTILTIGIIVIIGFSIYIAWRLWLTIVELEPAALAAWAVLVTLALPAVGGAAFWLGRIEARATLSGLAAGVEKVMDAADKAIGVRATAVREMQAARKPRPAADVSFNVYTPGLPGAPGGAVITPKALPPGDDVIEL